MTGTIIAGFAFGVFFVFLLFVFAVILTYFPPKQEMLPIAIFIVRVTLVLAAAGCAGVFTGAFDLEITQGKIGVRSSLSFGIAVLIYVLNPPKLIAATTPKPGKLTKRHVPSDRIPEPPEGDGA